MQCLQASSSTQALACIKCRRHAATTSSSVPRQHRQHQRCATAAREDTSAAASLAQSVQAPDLFLSGPQKSIHTAAEQEIQQQQQQQPSWEEQQQEAWQQQEAAGRLAAAVAAANEETSAANRADILKAIGISASACVVAGILDHDWVEQHAGLSMSLLFCLGYLGIFVEEVVGLNKAAVALVMAVSLWTIHSNGASGPIDAEIESALASVSELIFFLLGAMTVVEVVDSHGGFKRISRWVRADQRSTLAWFVACLTFCMSAVLDNLTTTIVMISILQRAVPEDPEFRKLLGAVVVVAANAGGACCVIGDLTTTMLWVNGQLTAWPTFTALLVPSFVSLAVPVAALCYASPEFQGPVTRADSSSSSSKQLPGAPPAAAAPGTADLQLEVLNRDVLVLAVGVGALLFVPVFKHLTGLPPYLGMLSGLGILWLVTDSLHAGESKNYPRVQDALRNLDIAGVMFFLGILLSVEALNAAGLLQLLAVELNKTIPDVTIVAAAIGLASAVIDNVPLVAATMGMYDASQVPPDSQLWQLIALCAGTGGSLLVIGSAAGVAFMGLEGAGFAWYCRRVSPFVLLGYVAANLSYHALHSLLPGGGM